MGIEPTERASQHVPPVLKTGPVTRSGRATASFLLWNSASRSGLRAVGKVHASTPAHPRSPAPSVVIWFMPGTAALYPGTGCKHERPDDHTRRGFHRATMTVVG